MATIRFEPEGVEIEGVPAGKRLVDLTDEHPETAVPYSCRSASCGTCRIEVLEGGTALAPPDDEEQDVLELFGDGPGVRLCCQVSVSEETARVVLRVLDPE